MEYKGKNKKIAMLETETEAWDWWRDSIDNSHSN